MNIHKRYLIILFGLLLTGTSAYGQQQSHQQHMQHQMKQMQDMTHRMNQMNDRVHMMNQEMSRMMEKTQNERVRNQYQMMHRMGEQMGLMLGNMKNAAERCNLMLQDRQMMQDRDMRKDMDRIREHLHDMTGQLEETLQTMERMTKRLRSPQTD